jgi:hypothetical protein
MPDSICPFTAVAHVDEGRVRLVRHPDSGNVVAFDSADDAFRFSVALGLADFRAVGTVTAPEDDLLHVVAGEEEAAELVRMVAFARTRRNESTEEFDDAQVLAVLRASGPRGASHEDFVEAGLAPRYVASMRRLVDLQGCGVSVEFTTGAARWVLTAERGMAAPFRAAA